MFDFPLRQLSRAKMRRRSRHGALEHIDDRQSTLSVVNHRQAVIIIERSKRQWNGRAGMTSVD